MRSPVLDTFQTASFRGVEFLFNDSSQNGGRKSHTFEYPNQDTRFVQDLGQLQRVYKIKAVIFRNDENYISAKNSLIDALETEGPGVFVHPVDGALNVFSMPYTVTESIEYLGVAEFSLTFEVTGDQIFPDFSASSASNIAQQLNNFISAINKDFASAWSTTSTFQGSVEYSTNLVQNMINEFKAAANIATNDQDGANDYNSALDVFIANKTFNIFNSTNFASNVDDLFLNMGKLSNNNDDRFIIYSSFFSYDPFPEVDQITVSNEQQEFNRLLSNQLTNVYALIYAYLFTTQTTFSTEDDIEIRNQLLNNQFFFVINGNTYVDLNNDRFNVIPEDTITLLEELRLNAHEYLRSQLTNSRKVIITKIGRNSLLPITFSFYNDVSLMETLAKLNDTVDLSNISGDYKVLTNES